MASKIAKLVQLFESGKAIQIPLPGGVPLNIWVQKLSPFHAEQCIHEGRVARARRMMAIREIGSDEYAVFQSQVDASSKDALVAGLVSVKSDETLGRVLRQIRTDKDWIERIEVIEHSAEHLESLDPNSIDAKQFAKMLDEYQSEIVERARQEEEAYTRELRDASEEHLRELFREHYVESQGMLAFTQTRQRYEVFYAARQCVGKVDGTEWDHSLCDHTAQMLDSVHDLENIPGEVIDLIVATLMEITVPPDLARFMAGPASSSESLGPSSMPEGSPASSPVATPGVPATTS